MSVIQMLPSAEIDDLPVVVKFVLQSVGDSDAFEVRRQLEITVLLKYVALNGILAQKIQIKLLGMSEAILLLTIT